MEEIRKKLPKASIVQSYGVKRIFILFRIKLEDYRVFFFSSTGTSETARAITCQTEKSKNLDTIGFPAPNNQIKIIDITTGNILEVNQTGEICVKQPNLMLGYYKNEEETKRVIDEEGNFVFPSR